MTYTKPELNILGDAALVIQDGSKPISAETDPVRLDQSTQFPAYDLDE